MRQIIRFLIGAGLAGRWFPELLALPTNRRLGEFLPLCLGQVLGGNTHLRAHIYFFSPQIKSWTHTATHRF